MNVDYLNYIIILDLHNIKKEMFLPLWIILGGLMFGILVFYFGLDQTSTLRTLIFDSFWIKFLALML